MPFTPLIPMLIICEPSFACGTSFSNVIDGGAGFCEGAKVGVDPGSGAFRRGRPRLLAGAGFCEGATIGADLGIGASRRGRPRPGTGFCEGFTVGDGIGIAACRRGRPGVDAGAGAGAGMSGFLLRLQRFKQLNLRA